MSLDERVVHWVSILVGDKTLGSFRGTLAFVRCGDVLRQSNQLQLLIRRLNCMMQKAFRLSLLAILWVGLAGCQPAKNSGANMNSESKPTEPVPTPAVTKTDDEWRQILSPEQYRVLRHAATERPYGPAYEEFKNQGGGTYVCAGCGAELFSSKHKFDSHCGWPSFYDPANAKNVVIRNDYSGGMVRAEVICAQCGGHLGHVFKGEGYKTPTDTRFCINGVSLKFIPASSKTDAP